MKRNYSPLIWLSALLLTLALSACVRPLPREEGATPAPTIEVPLLPTEIPTQVPPVEPPAEGEETAGEATAVPTAAAVAPSPTPLTSDTIYVVQPGDTLLEIARQFNVSAEAIIVANNLANPNRLEVGQELLIPAPGSVPETGDQTAEATAVPPTVAPPAQGGGTHVVQRGENLFRIGLRYGCTIQQMAAANGIANPNRIYAGQVLRVPDCN